MTQPVGEIPNLSMYQSADLKSCPWLLQEPHGQAREGRLSWGVSTLSDEWIGQIREEGKIWEVLKILRLAPRSRSLHLFIGPIRGPAMYDFSAFANLRYALINHKVGSFRGK